MIGTDGAEGDEASLSALPPEGGRMSFPPDAEEQKKRLRGELGR